jgi:CBS domain-containing protein
MSTVSKVMHTIVPTLKSDSKVSDAAKFLSADETGCIIILDSEKPIGIVTTLDIIKADVNHTAKLTDPVTAVMSYPLTSMHPDMRMEEALKLVDTNNLRRYPVIKNDQLVGLVTKKEIITAVSDNLKFHLNIQTSVLTLFVIFELFVFFYYYLPSIL